MQCVCTLTRTPHACAYVLYHVTFLTLRLPLWFFFADRSKQWIVWSVNERVFEARTDIFFFVEEEKPKCSFKSRLQWFVPSIQMFLAQFLPFKSHAIESWGVISGRTVHCSWDFSPILQKRQLKHWARLKEIALNSSCHECLYFRALPQQNSFIEVASAGGASEKNLVFWRYNSGNFTAKIAISGSFSGILAKFEFIIFRSWDIGRIH